MGAKILYIEDNPHHIEIVRRIVDREGYEQVAAADGLQGLEMAAAEQPIPLVRIPNERSN